MIRFLGRKYYWGRVVAYLSPHLGPILRTEQ